MQPALVRTLRGVRACTTATAAYPEELQARSVKPKEFYEEEAARRRYFYHVDLQVAVAALR
jgi:hypothetical protein